MGRLTLFLPELRDTILRYDEADEEVEGVVVVDDLPTAKQILRNRFTILLAEVNKLKLKDIT